MSTIRIYNTQLSPDMNACVDNIESYLDSLTPTYSSEVQYQKIELDVNIKLNINQEYQTKYLGNFLVLDQDSKLFYFFIMSTNWVAKNTVSLDISLDTINTFRNDFTFNSKTHIIREHKNRFSNLEKLTVGENTLYDLIDETSEGISGAIQYKVSDYTIKYGNDYTNQSWYLVYNTITDSEGISVELIPEHKIPIRFDNLITFDAANYNKNDQLYFTSADNSNLSLILPNTTYSLNEVIDNKTIKGLVLKVTTRLSNKYFIVYAIVEANNERSIVTLYSYLDINKLNVYSNTTSISYRTDNNVTIRYTSDEDISKLQLYRITNSHAGNTYSREIADIDRTDSRLVKIIELPYCPININWDSLGNIKLPANISLDDNKIVPAITAEFSTKILNNIDVGLAHTTTLTEATLANLPYYNRDTIVSDPKLKHSDLYTYKLSYDSFALPIALEKVTINNIFGNPTYNVEYKQSNNISSNLGFKLEFNNASYTTDQDYGTYLISNRSLESPIYTNEYINYMRNGYNFDRKNATQNTVMSYISAGIQIAGAIGAFIAGGATGGISAVAGVSLASSATATLASAISSNVENERNIQEKLNSARNQAATVNSCDDLNLLKWYNGNKLHVMEYQVSDKVKNLMNDLFYYCGYASDRYGTPKTNSRIWFNYLQCEPIFNEEQTSVYRDFLDDIKARYSVGVTYFHRFEKEYNFDRTKENWERILIEG